MDLGFMNPSSSDFAVDVSCIIHDCSIFCPSFLSSSDVPGAQSALFRLIGPLCMQGGLLITWGISVAAIRYTTHFVRRRACSRIVPHWSLLPAFWFRNTSRLYETINIFRCCYSIYYAFRSSSSLLEDSSPLVVITRILVP